jgi:glycosyltransferase involved in cell wall biosynthesis
LISETRELKQRATEAATGPLAVSGSRPTSLSIVIPCYNEKATIRSVVEAVLSADSCGLRKEVVIVDDCSKDGTRDVLAQMEQEYVSDSRGSLKVVYQPVNQGKGAAVRTGFQQAGGDVMLVQDADLEYAPEDFPHLLQPILDGHADAVFGNRFHGGVHRVLYFWHYQANRMLTLFCNMLSDLNLSDMEVGYKAFRKEIIQQLTLKANRFGFEPEVTIKTAKLGARIYEVPIGYYGRTYDEGKKIGWKDGVAALWHMIKYRYFD